MSYTLLLTPGDRCYWEFLVGVCHLVLRILSLFQTKKCHFPHSFSDQISKIHTLFPTWPNLACSGLSDSWGDSPVFSHFILVFALSQFSGPNYLRARNRLGLTRQKLEHEQKNSPNAFQIHIFGFRFYSFGIEMINTSIHVRSRSSLKNHTRFQTKMGKVFSDQKAQKPYPLGGTYLCGLYPGGYCHIWAI